MQFKTVYCTGIYKRKSASSSHLSWGTANQYSGCLPRPPNEWAGLEVIPEAKDFLIGFPTLKHRNMGGFLLFSSDVKSISTEIKIKIKKTRGRRVWLVYSHESNYGFDI